MSSRFRTITPAPLPRGVLPGPLLDPFFSEALFDRMPDIVFFVKNAAGEYVVVNDALVVRCGARSKAALIGRTPAAVFPSPLADSYAAQDRQVLAGRVISDRLEMHLYPDGRRGCCLTYKLPLREPGGRIIGIVGVSRDLHRPDERREDYRPIVEATEYLQLRYSEPLHARDLARIAGMPGPCFQRVVRRLGSGEYTCTSATPTGCSRPGAQNRSVNAVSWTADASTSMEAPSSSQSCVQTTQGYVAAYYVGPWGSCSASCGGGIQYRTVNPSSWKAIAPSAPSPADSQACNTHSCELTCYDYPDGYETWGELRSRIPSL